VADAAELLPARAVHLLDLGWRSLREIVTRMKEALEGMPLFRTNRQSAPDSLWPGWSDFTAVGVFTVMPNGRFDCHYHECDEYWLVFEGSARVRSEGVEYEVERGDVVCTRAGEEHDVVAVAEKFGAFFLEDRLIPGGERGHLHRRPELASGHVVPLMGASTSARRGDDDD